MKVFLTAVNATVGRLEADAATMMDLSELLTVDKPSPPGRRWQAQARLVNLKKQTVALGADEIIARFCQERGDELVYQPHPGIVPTLPDAQSWLHTEPFPFRDYQRTAILTALTKPRGLLLVPTGGGKTAILLTLIRGIMAQTPHARILWIVPTNSLLGQMSEAAKEFGVTFSVEKTSEHPVLLTTWQNLIREPAAFFAPFTHVLADEVHQYAAPSLQKLLSACVNAHIRWGVTATLPPDDWKQLLLRGTFGTAYTLTTSAELIENKTLNSVEIQPFLFQYRDRPPAVPRLHIPDDSTPREKAALKQQQFSVAYRTEMNWLIAHSGRRRAIGALVKSLTNRRLLVLFQRLAHGADLQTLFKKVCPGRPVYYIDGQTEADIRESIRLAMRAGEDTIILASFPTFSTGIDIPELGTIVLAEPTKSEIRVLQAIGRSLRRHVSKTGSVIYDIIDDVRTTAKPQRLHDYAFRHAQARQRIYQRVQFPIRPLIPVPIPESQPS